jgi:hypothetical protein
MDNLKYLKKMLADAHKEGFTFKCYYSGEEPDYIGTNTRHALDALIACDEMNLGLYKDNRRVGWAFIIHDVSNDPEETISDFSGPWLDAWWELNVGALL